MYYENNNLFLLNFICHMVQYTSTIVHCYFTSYIPSPNKKMTSLFG